MESREEWLARLHRKLNRAPDFSGAISHATDCSMCDCLIRDKRRAISLDNGGHACSVRCADDWVEDQELAETLRGVREGQEWHYKRFGYYPVCNDEDDLDIPVPRK